MCVRGGHVWVVCISLIFSYLRDCEGHLNMCVRKGGRRGYRFGELRERCIKCHQQIMTSSTL